MPVIKKDEIKAGRIAKEAQRKESILQRIIRSANNRTDRGHLNADSTEKGSYEPRGLILITGEDLPTLQSTLTRPPIKKQI